eukprot:Skav207505  [mRNA]  locus=scaffold334:347031:352411:- [translate_table: standard]
MLSARQALEDFGKNKWGKRKVRRPWSSLPWSWWSLWSWSPLWSCGLGRSCGLSRPRGLGDIWVTFGSGGFRVRVMVQLPKNERRRFDPEETGEDELALQEMSIDAAERREHDQRRLRRSYQERQQGLQQDTEFDESGIPSHRRQRLPVAEYKEAFLRAVPELGKVASQGVAGSLAVALAQRHLGVAEHLAASKFCYPKHSYGDLCTTEVGDCPASALAQVLLPSSSTGEKPPGDLLSASCHPMTTAR